MFCVLKFPDFKRKDALKNGASLHHISFVSVFQIFLFCLDEILGNIDPVLGTDPFIFSSRLGKLFLFLGFFLFSLFDIDLFDIDDGIRDDLRDVVSEIHDAAVDRVVF